MVYIPAGEITIGSPAREGDADEHPAHKVFLDGYWIGKTEVTFEQYDRFCAETRREQAADEGWGRGHAPGHLRFLEGRRGLLRLAGEKDRAAVPPAQRGRMGKSGPRPLSLGRQSPRSRPGQFQQGAHDDPPRGLLSPRAPRPSASSTWPAMSGNGWPTGTIPASTGTPPARPRRGRRAASERVVRGGSWANGADLVRSANRSSEKPESRLNILGFRLALDGE